MPPAVDCHRFPIWIPHLARLSRSIAAPHPGLWSLIAGIILVNAVWLAVSGIDVELDGFTVAAGGVAVLLLISAVLGPIKSDPVWRGMTLASAALVAFIIPVTILHYLTATLALPSADASLARMEGALGFDWPA